jgi:hypothetical protein
MYTLGAGIRRLGAESQLDEQTRARVSAIEQQAAEAAAALRGALRVLSAAAEQVALGVALREHGRARLFEHTKTKPRFRQGEKPAVARTTPPTRDWHAARQPFCIKYP